MALETKPNPPLKKTGASRESIFWVLVLALVVACILSTVIILNNPSDNEDLRHYKPEELSKKLIEVKKSALVPANILAFNRYKDSEEKRKAAIDVIFNELLSQTEDRLNIPSAVPPAEVASSSKEDLARLYDDPSNVPRDVYRTACLRIMNSRPDFMKFYQGKPKEMAKIVYEVLCAYYDRGKPPATMSMDELERYCHPSKTPKEDI